MLGVVFGVMGLGCAGVFLVGLVSGIQAARERAAQLRGSTPLPSNLPVWSPDPSLSNQLATDVTFDSYSLRLPSGYTPTNLPVSKQAPAGVRIQNWIWADAPAPDGTRRVIMAILAESTTRRHSNDLDGEVRAYLQGARREAVGGQFIPGSTTKGQLMGQPFARVTYTVVSPQVSLHTITFLGFDGEKRMLSLLFACKDAEGSEGYKLLETCLLSLKRR
ncbi:MAG TPA: hypothetical protein VFI31_04720 [Pirellulales bacterium]|nr:hypothetical protein [Pirellulales bacterium]